ncbi:hypothetical protein Hypma_014983 [Hypsizygus marmoreus]|uniref:Uncharacterized protein n=1 Tax=Hypsizygus marmoreus TaxID=39966 RepID=A0A369K7V8_HYPMA|nr:hypothetical protein Hypma_014983 [Hypsizygus marmoreus]
MISLGRSFQNHSKQRIGYRDPPEDFIGDYEHWDGVPFPESPTIRSTSLEHNTTILPNVSNTTESSPQELEDASPGSDWDTVHSTEVDAKCLRSLTPFQVMSSTWPVAILATGGYAQVMKIWVRDDIGISTEFQSSPVMFNKIWRGEVDGPEPIWTSQDVAWSVAARESAVRRVAHLARKPFNALMSNEMLYWAIALTLDPNRSIRPNEPSHFIWRPLTPDHDRCPVPGRRHAERTRLVVFNAARDVGIE